MAVAITRTDLSARELRLAASKKKDAKAARRMLALALVMEGVDRRTAAETCGMDRQTLLSVEQKSELAQMVREGPDPAVDGVVRWHRVDLQRKIEARLTCRDA